MSDNVEVRRSGAVEEIVFARPDKKNALTLDMYSAAAEALDEASNSDEVRCVVFSGAGGHFTAGNDLMDFMQDPPTDESSPVFQFLMALRNCPDPVAAAVDGYAIGIGTTMLLHCDLVWAAQDAQFRLPFVDLGVVPEAGSSLILPSMAGHRKAAELLFFGNFFGVEMAQDVGIINGVSDDVEQYAQTKAAELADKPPEALKLTKELLRQGDDEQVGDAMRAEAAHFVERLQSQEFMQAVASFQG